MTAESNMGMAHDQITPEEAERRGLVTDAIFLGDEVDGVGSWWHEGARRFWIAPAPPKPACYRPRGTPMNACEPTRAAQAVLDLLASERKRSKTIQWMPPDGEGPERLEVIDVQSGNVDRVVGFTEDGRVISDA